MIKILNNEKEIIPADTPSKIQLIITGCRVDEPSQRISLEKILELLDNVQEKFHSQIQIPPKSHLLGN
jgi:hypothetical protein